jgi:uncharacterized membrane protein YhaH (DUF805 family)
MTLNHLLSSFEGRINRAKFWLGFLIYLLVSGSLYAAVVTCYWLSARADEASQQFWQGVTLLVSVVALIVAVVALMWAFAIAVKRLHDRGKSGKWTIVFILLPWGLDRVSEIVDSTSELAFRNWIETGLSIATGAVLVWSLVELGILRGATGSNQYGEDPLVSSER